MIMITLKSLTILSYILRMSVAIILDVIQIMKLTNEYYDHDDHHDHDHEPIIMSTRGTFSRRDYLIQKKHPQIQWMIQRIRTIRWQHYMNDSDHNIDVSSSSSDCYHILDIGGGRGDLAVAGSKIDLGRKSRKCKSPYEKNNHNINASNKQSWIITFHFVMAFFPKSLNKKEKKLFGMFYVFH
jgi:hypothetical protein